MSAVPAHRGRVLLAAALARAGAWLVEPIEETAARPVELRAHPVIAVIGLAPDCGTTTLARALGVELGGRDAVAAAAVAGSDRPSRVPLAAASAGRLARALGVVDGSAPRTAGRLCLVSPTDHVALVAAVRHLAPLVLDVGHGGAPGVAASLSDHVVLVAPASAEPALAAVVAASIARVGPDPLLVVNRTFEPAAWKDRGALLVGETRAGAKLALAGRDPRGSLGEAVAELADTCERPRSSW